MCSLGGALHMFESRRGSRHLRSALLLLAFLFGTAIFAPLLASDLPLTMLAVNERAYTRALRSLPLVVDEYIGALTGEGDQNATAQAVELRIRTIGRGLPERYRKDWTRFKASFESASATSDELKELASQAAQLKAELRLASARTTGVRLEPVRTYPALAALTPLDSLSMFLFCAALMAPLWWSRWRRGALVVIVLIGFSLMMVSWRWGSASDLSGLKASMASGDVRVESALFTPVAFGHTETHLAEDFLAPAWLREPIQIADSAGVEVRPGEPAVNSIQRHWLGTDALGRDLLARLLYGGRLSLSVAVMAALLVTLIGVGFGTLAGMFGGWLDICFLRLVEIVQSFPGFLLILAGVAVLPENRLHPSITIALLIGAMGWTEIGRLVRAEFLRLRELDLAVAAYALGISHLRVAFRHLLPLALPSVFVAAAFATSGAVLTESAISFLGFGIGPPTPSWGGVIAATRDASIWWMQLFPGLFVFLTVVSFNLLGEGLRLRLMPEMRSKTLKVGSQ